MPIAEGHRRNVGREVLDSDWKQTIDVSSVTQLSVLIATPALDFSIAKNRAALLSARKYL
jgi:hypothetical protein